MNNINSSDSNNNINDGISSSIDNINHNTTYELVKTKDSDCRSVNSNEQDEWNEVSDYKAIEEEKKTSTAPTASPDSKKTLFNPTPTNGSRQ